MSIYYRPIIQIDKSKPKNSFHLGNQSQWFNRVEVLKRGERPYNIAANLVPLTILKNITKVRSNCLFQNFKTPKVVGVLNRTPDSFSDGGKHIELSKALKFVSEILADGVDLIDIGGESTRPGAKAVEESVELDRVIPIVKKILAIHPECKISIDTRKSMVMERTTELGVKFINDVSALSFDTQSAEVISKKKAIICLMHGGLNPQTMQENPNYADVLLDVYDYLEQSIQQAVNNGIDRGSIVIDPGIGFGKTIEHNISLIRNASLFHCLGVPILFGVSRKSFIGTIGNISDPIKRFPGSMAVALELVRQGVQMIRAHDVAETKQALALYQAII